MIQLKRSEAIKNFLTACTHRDLAELYNREMEVQVTVAQDGGDRIEGDFKGLKKQAWTDGLTTWHPIRIPKSANTEPEDNDFPIQFDLARHADGIGMTGWDWVARVSRWVAFDFDGLVGHSERHSSRLSESELLEVEGAVQNIPWVTVRRSTSGNGRHLYVFLEPEPTANHNEHAALARAILGMMSSITGFDFQAKVDVCGGNMWIWHRKMTVLNKGLTLIKQGSLLGNIPKNWRDHINVVSGRRQRTLPDFIEQDPIPDAERLFEELTGKQSRVNFDEEHRNLLAWLQENGHSCYYDQDHHMVITHTSSLKQAHEALNLRGIFNTLASGTEHGDHNAFMFPMRNGAWSIRRYTPGVQEAESWDQDGAGYTRCFFNKNPDLKTAARTYGGQEHPNGGYVFGTADEAARAAQALGVDLGLPNWALGKKTKLKSGKDDRLVAELDYDPQSDSLRGGLKNWLPEGRLWKRIFNAPTTDPIETDTLNLDDIVRHLVSYSAEDMGWALKTSDNWQMEPINHVGKALKTFNMNPRQIEAALGACVFRAWKLVSIPFQPEYPGDRQWNRGAARLRYVPTQSLDDLHYPTWLRLLDHLGTGLNDPISRDLWCRHNGIARGADYLKCWIASMLQYPFEPLPYLFFYGNEDCGKSSFHEALSLIIEDGVKRADNFLTSQQSFNGELLGAVVCVIEETDLREKGKGGSPALNRIKDWVTSKRITIHPKGETPYDVKNTTHWVQCNNNYAACPIFPGDTRITMIHVSDIPRENMIPKRILIKQLEKEAPDFLAEVLKLEIPNSDDRLNLKVVSSDEKLKAQNSNRSDLQLFISECCHEIEGAEVKFSEFAEKFWEWLDSTLVSEWTKRRISRELPPEFPMGRITTDNKKGQHYVGNLSFNVGEPKKSRWTLREGDILRRVGK